MFLALAGRHPNMSERLGLAHRASKGASFDELVSVVEASESAVDRLLDRVQPAVQARLRWDYQKATEEDETTSARVVFLHIMKTGGISLSHVCSDYPLAQGRARMGLYIDDLLLSPAALLARLRFIAGHIPFEALELVPGSFTTATVLRDPIARTISHFLQLRNSGAGYEDLTLDAFASSDNHTAAGNYQARQLAHHIDLIGPWVTYNPYERLSAIGGAMTEFPVSSIFDSTPVLITDNELYETAASNLAKIDLVGITENLGWVAESIAKIFGGAFAGLPNLHVSPPFDHRQLTDKIRKKLEEKTAVDRELYDQARRRTHIEN